MLDAITILTYAGAFIGGICTGGIGGRKFPFWKNGKNKVDLIATSEKTGGALRISEEGLDKFSELKKTIEDKYLTNEKHVLLCGKTQAEIMLYVSKQLEAHTDKIIAEIKEWRTEKAKQELKSGGW